METSLNYVEDTGYVQPTMLGDDRRVPIAIIFLVPFVISAVSLGALKGVNYVVWSMGVICAVSFFISAFQSQVKIPKEAILFWLFWAWSTLGAFNAVSSFLFWTIYFTVFQFCILITLVSGYSQTLRTAKILLISVMVATLILAASAYLSGEYQRAEAAESGQRAAGLALNANAFAVALVYGDAILLFLFSITKSALGKGFCLMSVIASTGFIIASASRKGFVGLLLVLVLWFVLNYGRQIRQRPLAAISIAALVGILLMVFIHGTTDTLLARRLGNVNRALYGGDTREGSIDVRLRYYKMGFHFIMNHPLFGLGLGNFIANNPLRQYSHNNYTEVFCSSGLPGGLLYYGIFLVLALRLRRLSGVLVGDTEKMAMLNFGKTVLLLRLISDLAMVSFYSKLDWVVLAIVIGWTYSTETRMREDAGMSLAYSTG